MQKALDAGTHAEEMLNNAMIPAMAEVGKSLVALMLEGNGFEVADLGADVAPEKFVEAIKEHRPQIVAMSALVTTTMPAMGKTIEAITAAGPRGDAEADGGVLPRESEFHRLVGL